MKHRVFYGLTYYMVYCIISDMEVKMKKLIWFFSASYIVIPGFLLWMAWTGQLIFRENLELTAKILLTIALFLASAIANYVAWSSFLGWKKRWGK